MSIDPGTGPLSYGIGKLRFFYKEPGLKVPAFVNGYCDTTFETRSHFACGSILLLSG